MRNVPPETAVAEALDAILEDLRESLAGLRRPAALIAAEEALLASRTARATAADGYRLACRANGARNHPLRELEAAVQSAKVAVAKADSVVESAQHDLDRRREEYGRTIAAAVATYRAAAATAVDRAAWILEITGKLAAAEHIALADVLAFSPAIENLIGEAHRAVLREKNREQRALFAAGAAIEARRYTPPAAAPVTWKGKLSDLTSSGVDDHPPVPIKPGPESTTQRIPPSVVRRVALRQC